MFGLKKEIKETIIINKKKKNNNIEVNSLYENDVTENEENFYESIYSGSLFSNEKIIIINNCTDKLIKQIENIKEKYPENLYIIILSDVLDKKSRLRNLFEKENKCAWMPCYLDSNRDLENIIIKNFREQKIPISKEAINL